MGRKHTAGLYKRGQVWHIEKQVLGQRLRESTGTKSIQEAEQYLAKRIEEVRQSVVYGVRPKRSFKEASVRFLSENQHKASIYDDALHLKALNPYIGDLHLEQVHIGSLQGFIRAQKARNLKTKSINNALEVVRHILNLAATEAGIVISSPVRGLRPLRSLRLLVSKIPKFAIATLSPLDNVLVIASMKVFSAVSAFVFEMSACSEIKSIKSCLFINHPLLSM